MTIHDYTGKENWSNNVDDWEDKFELRDIVIGDGFGSFRTMFVVHEIDPTDGLEKITHKGVFWDKSEAEAYAEDRHSRMHKKDGSDGGTEP